MKIELNDNKWYAVYVNSRSEKKVCTSLHQKNIEAYTPIVKTLREWSDRKKWVELPLINGYVFVNIEEKQKDSVLQTNGVVNYVYFDGKHAVVRDIEIEILKQIANTGYEISLDNTVTFNANDTVLITQGPLKGVECCVIKVTEDDTVLAYTINSIKQTMTVKLPKELFKHIHKN